MKHQGTVTIETARLFLRRFTPADADAMFQNWANDPAVTRCLTWCAHKSTEETRRILNSWEQEYRHRDFYEWAIVPKDFGKPVGSIGLVTLPEDSRCLEAGYCLGVPWWGMGYATEALKAVLDFGLNVIGCRKIAAKHAMENPASGRVMQKAGMTMRVGEILPVSTANGTFECLVYEILRPKQKGIFKPPRRQPSFYTIHPERKGS